MASVPKGSRTYDNIHAEGNSRMHLGDVYNNYQSSDERAVVAILDSLSYHGISDRRDALAEAHERTFDWTFLEGRTDFLKESHENYDRYQTVNMNFKSWLQHKRQGLFCVTGKPGSGKSTFMKMLAANNQATAILENWAGDAILLRCDHFFWILGAPMQKTVEGLLRGILHSALLGLSQCENFDHIGAIKYICGSRWQSAAANGVWSRRELKQMLIRLGSLSSVKSFFLIDALDECEPQDRLGDLVNEVLWMSQLPNVKLCVSCRPWEVFTRRFEFRMSLRLDQLTRRDMEIYIEARLTTTEKERGWGSEVCNGTREAKQLIRSIARDAEGVFLWTELVVNAICSEMRKGRMAERLGHMLSDFPNDLDDYFHRLIFDRIGRSRQNVEDTAAALKLALVVHASTQLGGTALPTLHSFADSFVNFWLLSNGHLRSGFSWTDCEQIFRPSFSQMLDQTVGYLEETCKNLLVANRETESFGFLHRTVFDFSSDDKLYETLEHNAPSHFSGEDFIFDLARLRCICVLRTHPKNCYWLGSKLDQILENYENLTHMDQHTMWFSKMGDLMFSAMQENNCYPFLIPLGSERSMMPSRCVKAGLTRPLLELTRLMPALGLEVAFQSINLLGEFLQATNQPESRRPDLSLMQHMLDIGCDPNRNVGRWPHSWNQRYPFDTNEVSAGNGGHMPRWCIRTVWTAWLGEAFTQIANMTSNSWTSEPNESLLRRKRQAAEMIALLLQAGANPHCMICVTDHWESDDTECHLITLDRIMEIIAPTAILERFRILRNLCSHQATSYALRRNQRRRAARSIQISDRFFESLANDADDVLESRRLRRNYLDDLLIIVENVADVRHGVCNGCFRRVGRKCALILATWCLDCGGLSTLCHFCFERDPSQLPTLGYHCGGCTGHHNTANDSHTSVVLVCEESYDMCAPGPAVEGYREGGNLDHLEMARSLHPQHTKANVISTIKEWYARNPIEPELSFKEVIRSTCTGSALSPYRRQEPNTTNGQVPMEQGSSPNRPWLL